VRRGMLKGVRVALTALVDSDHSVMLGWEQ
jgi:hypothetical protein